MTAKWKKMTVPVGANKDFAIYASVKHQTALGLINEMSLFEGVKITALLHAAYTQGRKDGASEALDQVQAAITQAAGLVKHRNPGQPKKLKRAGKRK